MDIGFSETWCSAARAFADLVGRVPGECWEGPGLGAWTLRDLIGHTCSAGLRTVVAALGSPADTEVIPSPEAYYAFARTVEPAVYEAAVAHSSVDARQHGIMLGDRPAEAVRHLAGEAVAALDGVDGTTLVAGAAGGMRLDRWLPTRTFELAVHSLDVATATGLRVELPERVTADAAALAARIATATGDGQTLLLAMTGRGPLPDGFSVV
jgi:hypothetical protein